MLPAERDPDEFSRSWSNLLKKLSPDQVRQIDEALDAVGDYGEVHLIVQRGELRYVNKVESFKAVRRGDGAGPGS